MDLCERSIVLCDGRVIADGKSFDILQNDTLLEEAGLERPLRLQGYSFLKNE